MSIGSGAEAELVNRMVASDRQYWIGYSDVLDSGNWTWADGSQTNYENWEKPLTDSDKKCAVLGLDRQWKQVNCEERFRLVCEWPLSAQQKRPKYEYHANHEP